jgi:DNA-binding XRE family transcriptional regulator
MIFVLLLVVLALLLLFVLKAKERGRVVAKNLNDVLDALPPKRRAKVEQRAGELATLKDLRLAVAHTQQDLAASLGVGQDTISRIERRSDLLLSTLRRYIQAMGGELDLVARFPNRPPVLLDHIAQAPVTARRSK